MYTINLIQINMKKITLFLIAFLVFAFSQSQNLALSGTATASTELQPASNAIDGNTGTRWESEHLETADITVDLGASYTIGQIILNWEGAFADQYEILISDDPTFATSTTIYTTTTGDGGIDDLSVTGTGQYVRMNGLNRYLGAYGFSLYEFEIYGAVDPVTDATLSDLTVDGTTVDGFSSNTLTYNVELPNGTTVVPTVIGTPSQSSPATAATTDASGLPGTSTVLVTAQDGTTTNTYTINFTVSAVTTPTVAAPTPPARDAADYISVFSDAYTNVATVNLNPGWGQATVQSEVDIAGDNTLSYANFNYQGTDFGGAQDISSMEFLHVDIWTNTETPNVFVISSGAEIPHPISSVEGAWQSLDIPIAGITGDLTSAIQFKFDGGTGETIYIDNLYFWKNPSASGTDATLSDLQVDMSTVTGFSSNTKDYSVVLPMGTTDIPQITSATTTDTNANATITQATALPGDATVLVTAQDGTTTKTYTVSFSVAVPTAPTDNAPTAPARSPSDVISIYGSSYGSVVATNYDPNWGQSGLGQVNSAYDPGTGSLVLAYPNFNYQGTELTTQDASTMEYLHIDLWTAADPMATDIQVSPINNGTGTGEVLVSITYTSGTWVSVDIPIGDFTGMTWDSVYQMKFAANGAGSTVPVDIYLDNVYFYKTATSTSTWTGAVDSNWTTAGNWSTSSVPTIASDVTIPNAASVIIDGSTGATVNDLTVDAGGSLTISSGGSLIVNGNSTGDITYTLSIPDDGWHLVSVPLAGVTYDQTWMDNNSIAIGTVNASHRGIGTYQNGTPSGSTGPWTYFTNASTGTFAQDEGYIFKRTGAGNYNFTGTYPNTDVNAPITQGSDNNWNLLANPYPTYLDISELLTSNDGNFDASYEAVYVWNGSAYVAISDGQYIHPGQSFLIRSNVLSSNASIAKALRTHTTGSFLRANHPTISLMLSNGTDTVETEINYLNGKTKGLDRRFDLGMFDGTSSKLRVYTHLLDNNENVAFQKQALPNTGLETMIIPVGVKADANQEITFSAEAMQLPIDMKVFLEDKLANTFTRLDEVNTEYTITLSEALNGTGRFFLHTSSKSALSVDDIALNNISIYKANASTLRIVGLQQGKTDVKLYTILGKEVLHSSFEANGAKDIALPTLAKGIYIVQLANENSSVSKKIILE